MSEPRELTTCAEHGLTYDTAIHTGCVVCRRGAASPPRSADRRFLYIVGGGCLIVGAAVFGGYRLYLHRQSAERVEQRVAQNEETERMERQTSVTTIAPGPLPTALPLLGAPGKSTDGYAAQWVDRPALRSLLWHKKYVELSQYFEQFQAAFEADPFHEYWPNDAADAFDSSEPELLVAMNEWVAATPDSFAPYLARGTYWTNAAYTLRGGKWASETPASSMTAMADALDHAMADLDRALASRPKLVVARRRQIIALRAGANDARFDRLVSDTLAACPTCFIPRITIMYSLTPRWGGSYALMDSFAKKSAAVANPRMKLLAGFADLDRADMLEHDSKHEEALATIQRACALGDLPDFLVERARIQRRRKENALSLADLEQANGLHPGTASILFERAWTYSNLTRFEPAGRDLLAGLRVDPTDSTGRHVFASIVHGLNYEGWQHYTAGRRDEALRVYDLAAELAPLDKEIHQRRSAVIIGAPPNEAPGLAALEQAARDQPDDLRAHQKLDYALAQAGKFDQVVVMWTDYLSRNPRDGMAYLERGGAYFNMRRLKEAHADAAKACELGVSEGCARAKQIAPMVK